MRWCFAAAAIALPACSLFVDLSDLSTGAGIDGGDFDAPFSEAGPVDAGANDATTTDAAADAGDGSFCASLATKPTFCSDFDEAFDGGEPPPWTGYDGLDDGGAFIEVSGAQAKSAPQSLHAFTHGGFDQTDLTTKVPVFSTSAHLEADVFVGSAPIVGSIAPVSIVASISPNDHYLLLYLSDSDVYLQNGDTTGATMIVAQRNAAASPGWHHATIDVNLGAGGTSTASGAIDGVPFGTDAAMPYPFAAFDEAVVYVGAVGVYNAGPYDLYLDNVVYDAH